MVLEIVLFPAATNARSSSPSGFSEDLPEDPLLTNTQLEHGGASTTSEFGFKRMIVATASLIAV